MADFESLSRSFGGVTDAYERARPSYPPEAIEAAIAEFSLSPDSTALDLAAGTGKLTWSLAGRFEHVIAVEPSPEMLAVVRSNQPEVDAREGGAEAIPAADGEVDAVFIAQAFHWFANHPALREIARVLKPAGGLALIWNISPWEAGLSNWWRRFDAILHQHSGDVRDVRDQTTTNWQRAFDGDQPFEPLRRLDFAHTEQLPLSAVSDILLSRSYVAALSEPARADLLAEIDRHLELPGAPVAGGSITLDYATELYLTRPR